MGRVDEICKHIEEALAIRDDEPAQPVKYLLDQFGVVWFTGGRIGAMSASTYEALRLQFPANGLVPLDKLPPFDALAQTIMAIE